MKRKGEQPQGVATFCGFPFHFSLFFLTIYLIREKRRREEEEERRTARKRADGVTSYLAPLHTLSSAYITHLFSSVSCSFEVKVPLSCRVFPESCGKTEEAFLPTPVLSCALIEKGRRRIKDKAETKKRSCPRLWAYVYFLLSCFLLFSFWTLTHKKCLRRGGGRGSVPFPVFLPCLLINEKTHEGEE